MIPRLAAAAAAIAGVTLVYTRVIHVNPTTIALSYLVVILLISTSWGIAEATISSILAVLCFNFFFLPPVGTFTIADPQNWVALVTFLLTAVVTSQLSGRARKRTEEAFVRQRDLERLYALSRSLLLLERHGSWPGQMARHIVDAFELDAGAVYDQRIETISWAGPRDVHGVDSKLRDVVRTGVALHDPAGVVITPVQLGGTPIGAVALADAPLSDTVVQSIANLVAIGLERARADEASARADAARESSELRATVLDALAHEFKTPLTSMKAASSDLRGSDVNSRDRELVAIIDEDLDRLQALVTDAVHMLRIDAGDFAVHPGRQRVAALIADTLQRFERRLEGRTVTTDISETLTVDADRDLLALAVRQLLDNALKYSPSDAPIDIRARSNGTVDVSVHNGGSTIADHEQARIFERFYRGAQARHIPGTGMGLAIVQQIARAHGGTLNVSSSPDRGTTFTLALPRGTGS